MKFEKRIFCVISYIIMLAIMVTSIPCGGVSRVKAAVGEKEDTYIARVKKEGGGEEDNILITELSAEEAKEMKKDSDVIQIEKDFNLSALGKTKKKKNEQKKEQKNSPDMAWNMDMIDRSEIEVRKPEEKDKIKVAVLDSGMDFSDEVNVIDHIDMVGDSVPVYFEDITGHGTSVSSIISDINPYADIYSVRVLDGNNSASLSSVIQGIEWCIENDMDIINMSFGTKKDSDIFHEVIHRAYQKGILMIAAAGNSDMAGVDYPAAYPEVMAVGGTDSSGEKTEESSVGSEVELVAPGDSVEARGLFNGRVVAGGTSMAAPHVAGVASLIWQEDSTKSAQTVRASLNKSAKDMEDKTKFGNGMLDADDALAIFSMQDDVAGEDIVYENTEKVETYDTSDMVEGKWDKADHKTKVDKAVKIAGGLSKADIEIVKEGVVAQDQYLKWDKKDANTSKYMMFHGMRNYVNAYAYLMKMALKCRKSGLTEAKKVSYPNKNAEDNADCAKMKSYITADLIKKVLKKENAKYNARNAALVLMGMAMHVIGDTYAHRAYKSGSPYWIHIKSPDADVTSETPERYVATGYAMGEVLALWNGNCNPSFEEYDLIGIYNHSAKFRLESLCLYSARTENGIDYSYYQKNIKKLSCHWVKQSTGNVGLGLPD